MILKFIRLYNWTPNDSSGVEDTHNDLLLYLSLLNFKVKCIGVAFCAVFEFQKSSHSQPLEWPQVAASGRSVEWPQVTASGRLRRVAEVFQSHKKQPLAATRSHSQPLEWPQVAAFPEWPQVAASGRLYHITSWIQNWGKHPLAAAGSLPIHLNLKKKHLSNKTYFFKMFEDYR